MPNEKEEPKGIDLSEFEGKYSIDEAKKVVEKMKDKLDVAIIGSVGIGKTAGMMAKLLANNAPDPKGVILVETKMDIPEPTKINWAEELYMQSQMQTDPPPPSYKSGKQLRNERRAQDRKGKKHQKKKK